MSAYAVVDDLLEVLGTIARSGRYPDPELAARLAGDVLRSLSSDRESVRPLARSGAPGGLVRVATPLSLVVPDIHARPDFLPDLFNSTAPVLKGARAADQILDGRLTVVCLGDIINAEGRIGAARWAGAMRALNAARGLEGILSPEMDEEMGASLKALCGVMFAKSALGQGFHCLKGNHDNLTNSSLDGDSAFYKFACEGAMGAEWFRRRYGEASMRLIRTYERLLPLAAAGKSFCASHAEPAFPLSEADLLDYADRPDVVRALIWTADGQAEPDAAERTLGALSGAGAGARGVWISGHRPVAGNYALRARGRLVQIHNPERRNVALIEDDGDSTLGISLYEVGEGGGELRFLETVPTPHLDLPMPRH